MIKFCADDYGISKESCDRIEDCVKNGVLNKISVLPNGEIADFVNRFSGEDVELALHVNLVEGRALTDPREIPMITLADGRFKYSFIGLLTLSLFSNRKEFERQIYKEIQSQLRFWKKHFGEDAAFSLDSHQHACMIPAIFKTFMQVIRDENIKIGALRIASEPLLPYLSCPSLYLSYSPSGLVKQWLLNLFAFINRREMKRAGVKPPCFMGVMFSGNVNEERVRKLLPHYLKVAEKRNQYIEIGLHPGYIKEGEALMNNYNKSFEKFYFSKGRYTEYQTLINLKSQNIQERRI